MSSEKQVDRVQREVPGLLECRKRQDQIVEQCRVEGINFVANDFPEFGGVKIDFFLGLSSLQHFRKILSRGLLVCMVTPIEKVWLVPLLLKAGRGSYGQPEVASFLPWNCSAILIGHPRSGL